MRFRTAALLVVTLGLGALVWVCAPQAQPAADCVVVDNFAKDKVRELPFDWKVRKDAGKEVYAVQEEGGLRFLRAHSKGLGIQAAKQYEWDLNAYPVLAWSWRPREFPRGADEKD